MTFLWDFLLGFLWDFHDISMIILWDYYGISVRFLWGFKRISMVPKSPRHPKSKVLAEGT